MEALSLLEKLDIDPAIKAALAAGFQSDFDRHQERNLGLEARVRHDGFIIEKLKLELAHLRRIQFGRKSESLQGEQHDLFNEAVAEALGNLSEATEALTSDAGTSQPRNVRE